MRISFQVCRRHGLPNFNPETQDKPSWLAELAQTNDTQIAFSDETYRRRAQALAGIDEFVGNLVDVLGSAAKLNETILIFSSDHGYHLGQHRIPAGKTLPYKEDTHVPFLIAGPGVPKGSSILLPSTHVDIAPTILSFTGLAKEKWPSFLDGRDLSADWKSDGGQTDPAEVINIEFWGNAVPEGALSIPNGARNTYKTVRIVGEDYGYLYSHWCTNETEIYDTTQDPFELNRIQPTAQPALVDRLNAVLLATKTCVQDSCRDSWGYLHPNSNVTNLEEALDPAYDEFYAALPRVSFKQCLNYQSPSNEESFYPGFNVTAPYAFAQSYRNATDLLGTSEYPGLDNSVEQIPQYGHYGAVYQDLAIIEKDARVLTDAELSSGGAGAKKRSLPYYG